MADNRVEYELGVDMRPLNKGLDQAESAIKRSGKTAEQAFGRQGTAAANKMAASQGVLVRQSSELRKGILSGVGIGGGLVAFSALSSAIGTVTDFMGDAVSAASDLAESQSKVDQVFTTSAQTIHAWASDAARDFGLSTQAALEAAGTFGNFIQALGNTETEANEMSRTIVELAADLASFNNQSIDEVILALRSGLAGEAEPMRRLGVSISAARVEANILAKGIASTSSAITDAMKVAERYSIILQDTSKAQGDFDRTSEGLANKERIRTAKREDALAKFGANIMPVMLAIEDVGIGAMEAVAGLSEAIGELVAAAEDLINPGKDVTDTIESIAATLDSRAARSFSSFAQAQRTLAGQSDEVRAKLDEVRVGLTRLGITTANSDSLIEHLGVISRSSGEDMRVTADRALQLAQNLDDSGFAFTEGAYRIELWRTEIQNLYVAAGLVPPVFDAVAAASARSNAKVSEATTIYRDWLRTTEDGRAELARLNAEFDILSGIHTPPVLIDTGKALDRAGWRARVFASGLAAVAAASEDAASSIGDLKQASKEAEKAWDRMSGKGDRNKRTIQNLDDAIQKWAKRYRKAVRDIDSEEAEFSGQQVARLTEQRDLRQAQVDRTRDLARQLKNLPDKATVTVSTPGLDSALSKVGKLPSLLSMVPAHIAVRFAAAGLPRTAGGGPTHPRMGTIVGERGPEWFVPDVPGRIVNQQQAAAAVAGGSRPAVNVTVVVNAGQFWQPVEAQRWAQTAAPVLGRELARIGF